MLREALEDMPLIAILRGIVPEEVEEAVETLTKAGIRIIEIPLNSPRPYKSLSILARLAGGDILGGAGTVLTVEEVRAVAETGVKLVVSPNADPAVICAAKQAGLFSLPGVATPSEAFAALAAGADGLKMFPGEVLPPAVLKAWRAVLPAGTLLLPVGGITPGSMADYVAAGADGFGIGSALYKPGRPKAEFHRRVNDMVAACRSAWTA